MTKHPKYLVVVYFSKELTTAGAHAFHALADADEYMKIKHLRETQIYRAELYKRIETDGIPGYELKKVIGETDG